MVWDQNIVDRFRYVDNKWDRAINFCFEWVKEGYIVKFSSKCNESFNVVEKKFVIIPRRRLLEEISLWINIMFVENEIMCMEPNIMVEQTPSCKMGGWKEGRGREGKGKDETSRRNLEGDEMR
jgi:hypothetical protein